MVDCAGHHRVRVTPQAGEDEIDVVAVAPQNYNFFGYVAMGQNGLRVVPVNCLLLPLQIDISMDDKDNTCIEHLKKLLCEAVERQMNRASDFVFLQAYVFERTRENIGLNTLKRIWNYGNTPVVPRIFTLDVLSKAIGYRNFEDLKHFYGDEGADSSDKVFGKVVSSSDLRPGDRVTLCWDPGRRCTVEYLGSNAYRVLSSEQTKLKPGNTFQAAFFATGSPLILSNLVQDDSFATLYEIGRKSGVTQLTVETEVRRKTRN